jgi:hypothetical protein
MSIKLEDEVIKHLGISDQIHVQRFKSSVEAVRKKQSQLNANHGYDELHEECQALRKANPTYALPRRVEQWKPLDVVFFLTQKEYAMRMEKLVRPIANKRLDGQKVWDMCNSVQSVSPQT